MMKILREKNLILLKKLMVQTTVPAWSLANQLVISSLVENKKNLFGKKSILILKLMKVAYRLKLSDSLIFLIGVSQVFFKWKKIKKEKNYSKNQNKKIFAGFGANAEESIYRKFIKHSTTNSILRVNWVTGEGLSMIGRPDFFSLIKNLLKYSFGYTKKLESSIEEISSNRDIFLAVCAMNIGGYVFFQTYWSLAKKQGMQEAIFLAPSIAAFASVDVGLHTIFHQHGLLGFGILFPNIHAAEMITEEELVYLKNLLPETEFKKIDNNLSLINKNELEKTVLILSVNGVTDQDTISRIELISSFVSWVLDRGFRVVIRPTFTVTAKQIDMIQSAFPRAAIDNLNASLEESYRIHKPSLVASWNSTGLILALSFGATAVSFCDKEKDDYMLKMIYPFEDKVLFWPRDKERLC